VHRAAWTAVLVGSITRKPVVATEHSTEFGASRITESKLRRARIAFRRADLVCPVSDSLRLQMENHGIRAKFRIVPNVVDTEVFYPGPPSGDPNRPVRLITVAALIETKGHMHLLEALAPLHHGGKRFRLDLVGKGPYRQQLEKHVKRLGLEGVVTFHGYQPKHGVASLMREADFLVLPSLAENLPVAVIEAMATGLPVVATRVGGLSELVDDAVGVLVEPGNSGALRDAIDEMLDRHSAYSPDAITTKARTRYSTTALGEVWRDIYDEVLSKPQADRNS
jgi:glycosyltransferase involved in cell wall biosynthesis